MWETAIALLTAHLLADFLLQTNWIVRNKRNALVFALHGLIVFVLTVVVPGTLDWRVLAAITLTHLAMDWVKTWWLPSGLASFAADQLVHIAAIVGVSWLWPATLAEGWWLQFVQVDQEKLYVGALIIVSALVAATSMGAVVIAQLLDPYETEVKEADTAPPPAIREAKTDDETAKAAAKAALAWAEAAKTSAEAAKASAGEAARSAQAAAAIAPQPAPAASIAKSAAPAKSISNHVAIGIIERLIVLMLVLTGQFTAVGFLITAKSILRFSDLDTAYKRKMTEFIIVGTMASFGWALFVGIAASSALQAYGLGLHALAQPATSGP